LNYAAFQEQKDDKSVLFYVSVIMFTTLKTNTLTRLCFMLDTALITRLACVLLKWLMS